MKNDEWTTANGRRTPSNDESSNGLWPDELIISAPIDSMYTCIKKTDLLMHKLYGSDPYYAVYILEPRPCSS